MKALRNVKNENGIKQTGWKFGTFKNVWNCGGNLANGRMISGWMLVSPDGCERSLEGNWEQFVPYARMILKNYGCTSTLS